MSLFPKPFNNNFLQRDISVTVLSPVLNSSIQVTYLLENLNKILEKTDFLANGPKITGIQK